MVSISACHADDPGSIPGRGACFLSLLLKDSRHLIISPYFESAVGLVVRISAFHADGPGSIPGQRIFHVLVDCLIRLRSYP